MITSDDWFKIGQIIARIDGGCSSCVSDTYNRLQRAFPEDFDPNAMQRGIFTSDYGEYLKISMKLFDKIKIIDGGKDL